VLARSKHLRMKLHPENYAKSKVFKQHYGTITPLGFRSKNYVQFSSQGEVIRGSMGGFTESEKNKSVFAYDHNWSQIGQ
jgi:hypothetical protein